MKLKSMITGHWEKIAAVSVGCAIVAVLATGVRSKAVGQLCAGVRGGTEAVNEQMDRSAAPELPPFQPPHGMGGVAALSASDWTFYRPTLIFMQQIIGPDKYKKLVAPEVAAPVADFGSVTVSWKEGKGNTAVISRYAILRKAEGESDFREVASVSGATLSHKDETVEPDTAYTYVVKCASDYNWLDTVSTDSNDVSTKSKRLVELDLRCVTLIDGHNRAGVLVRKMIGGTWVERMFYVTPGESIGGQVAAPFANGRSTNVDLSSGFTLVRLEPVAVIRGACKISTTKAVCTDGRGRTREIMLAR